MTSPIILLSGKLQKRGATFGKWIRRMYYITLHKGTYTLCYKRHITDKDFHGEIVLSNFDVLLFHDDSIDSTSSAFSSTQNNSYSFMIETRDKVLILRAPNAKERSRWVGQLTVLKHRHALGETIGENTAKNDGVKYQARCYNCHVLTPSTIESYSCDNCHFLFCFRPQCFNGNYHGMALCVKCQGLMTDITQGFYSDMSPNINNNNNSHNDSNNDNSEIYQEQHQELQQSQPQPQLQQQPQPQPSIQYLSPNHTQLLDSNTITPSTIEGLQRPLNAMTLLDPNLISEQNNDQILVTVIKAQGLKIPGSLTNLTARPYCLVKVDQNTARTKTVKSDDPTWDFSCQFPLTRSTQNVNISVHHNDMFGSHTLLGRVSIPISHLEKLRIYEAWFALANAKGQGLGHRGKILVQIVRLGDGQLSPLDIAHQRLHDTILQLELAATWQYIGLFISFDSPVLLFIYYLLFCLLVLHIPSEYVVSLLPIMYLLVIFASMLDNVVLILARRKASFIVQYQRQHASLRQRLALDRVAVDKQTQAVGTIFDNYGRTIVNPLRHTTLQQQQQVVDALQLQQTDDVEYEKQQLQLLQQHLIQLQKRPSPSQQHHDDQSFLQQSSSIPQPHHNYPSPTTNPTNGNNNTETIHSKATFDFVDWLERGAKSILQSFCTTIMEISLSFINQLQTRLKPETREKLTLFTDLIAEWVSSNTTNEPNQHHSSSNPLQAHDEHVLNSTPSYQKQSFTNSRKSHHTRSYSSTLMPSDYEQPSSPSSSTSSSTTHSNQSNPNSLITPPLSLHQINTGPFSSVQTRPTTSHPPPSNQDEFKQSTPPLPHSVSSTNSHNNKNPTPTSTWYDNHRIQSQHDQSNAHTHFVDQVDNDDTGDYDDDDDDDEDDGESDNDEDDSDSHQYKPVQRNQHLRKLLHELTAVSAFAANQSSTNSLQLINIDSRLQPKRTQPSSQYNTMRVMVGSPRSSKLADNAVVLNHDVQSTDTKNEPTFSTWNQDSSIVPNNSPPSGLPIASLSPIFEADHRNSPPQHIPSFTTTQSSTLKAQSGEQSSMSRAILATLSLNRQEGLQHDDSLPQQDQQQQLMDQNYDTQTIVQNNDVKSFNHHEQQEIDHLPPSQHHKLNDQHYHTQEPSPVLNPIPSPLNYNSSQIEVPNLLDPVPKTSHYNQNQSTYISHLQNQHFSTQNDKIDENLHFNFKHHAHLIGGAVPAIHDPNNRNHDHHDNITTTTTTTTNNNTNNTNSSYAIFKYPSKKRFATELFALVLILESLSSLFFRPMNNNRLYLDETDLAPSLTPQLLALKTTLFWLILTIIIPTRLLILLYVTYLVVFRFISLRQRVTRC